MTFYKLQKEEADNICSWVQQSLDNEPEKWIVDDSLQYTLDYKDNKDIGLWMISGFMFFGIRSSEILDFPFIWKMKLWRKAKKIWRERKQGTKSLKRDRALQKIFPIIKQ